MYVKTNPGDSGSGIISNITYEDMRAFGAVWYAQHTAWHGMAWHGIACVVRTRLIDVID